MVVIDKRNSDRRINEMDDALSIFDGTEDIDYSKMYPSTDDDKSENVFTERINIIWLS